MSKKEALFRLIDSKRKSLKMALSYHYDETKVTKACDQSLRNSTHLLAKYYLADGHKDLSEIKYLLNVSAMMYEYFYKTYNENWLPTPTLMALSLSDHQEMLLRLCKMRKIEYYQDEGGGLGFLNAFYNIVEGDWEALKETLVYLKNIRGDYAELFYPDIHFQILEGFIRKDVDAIEMGLDELLQHEQYRKQRIADMMEEAFVAFEVLAFAKQAWRHGIPVWQQPVGEITIESDLIPKQMLPYKPLKAYTIPFKFLYEFYQSEGVNWRYEPLYPEIEGGKGQTWWGKVFKK